MFEREWNKNSMAKVESVQASLTNVVVWGLPGGVAGRVVSGLLWLRAKSLLVEQSVPQAPPRSIAPMTSRSSRRHETGQPVCRRSRAILPLSGKLTQGFYAISRHID
jgi:hypothetical protein